jgi:hypothetical protein
MKLAKISVFAAICAGALSAPAAAVAPPSAAASVASDGTLTGGIAVTSASRVDTGVYTVTFADAKVPSDCAFTAGIGSAPGADQIAALVNVGGTDSAGTISVHTYSAQTRAPADLPFNVYVAC